MKAALCLFVCLIAVSPVFSGVCDPSCRADPASKCLSTGKCLCWWGWTGANAHYILTGFLKNRIIADKCDTACSYSRYHRNQNCAKIAMPKPPPPHPGKCVVPHVSKHSTQVPCHPKCQPVGYQSNGRCLQNGRCLCFWGWTGTNGCYITGSKHKKQILADFCTIPCHYTHDYSNPFCLLPPAPTTANPSTRLSTQFTTRTTTQAATTKKVSTKLPTTYETTPEPTTLPTTSTTDYTTDITNNPTTHAPPQTTTEVPTTARPTTVQPTTSHTHTTDSPSTMSVSTLEPTTMQPSTQIPTTDDTTQQPSTPLPTTEEPTTLVPTTTLQPTTLQPTTLPSTTLQPSTQEPTTTEAPTTKQPTTLTTTEQTTIATTIPETTTKPTTRRTTMQTTTETPTTEEPEPTEPTEPGQLALSFKRSSKKVTNQKRVINQKSIVPMAIDNSKEASLLGIVSASLIIILIVFVTGWMMHKRFGRHAGYQRLII